MLLRQENATDGVKRGLGRGHGCEPDPEASMIQTTGKPGGGEWAGLEGTALRNLQQVSPKSEGSEQTTGVLMCIWL